MDIDANIQRGEALFLEGHLDESERVFHEILSFKPDHYETLNNLGVISHSRGAIEEAEQYFLKSLEGNGEYLDALSNLADLYEAAGRKEKEAECLERLLTFSTDDHNILNRLGFLFLSMGKEDRALSLFESSLALFPNQAEVIEALQSLKPASHLPGHKGVYRKHYTPRVSIGLPVYNGGKYLAEAIESILNQDFEDFELIISDNASTDGTPDICHAYAKAEPRIHLVRQNRNVGMVMNFLAALGLSRAPYFKFATHDDLYEKSFLSACLKVHEADPSVVLAYPQTKLLNSESVFLGIAKDHVRADQKDPIERFKHLIWEIGLCNMVMGLFRSGFLKTSSTYGKSLFGDNLLLAEAALCGKIIQIPEQLFIRRFTRNYNYNSPDDRNAQLIGECHPDLFNEGLYFPHCRLAFAHLDLLNNAAIDHSDREKLMQEVITCFKSRFGDQMKYEIDRAVHLISQGIFYWTWRNDSSEAGRFGSENEINPIDKYRITILLKNLQEALLLFPERMDLLKCYEKCLNSLRFSWSESLSSVE